MSHNNLSWWGNNTWNWGDQLNPWLYSKITGIPVSKINRIELWDKSNTPRYYVIGSILNHTHSPNVEVWGSGLEGGNYPIPHLPSKLNAVRGPLTRKVLIALGCDCPEIYGDPALLLPKYYTPNVKKEYKYGVVQHFLHKQETAWISKYKNDPTVNIIDIQNPSITDFIDEINKCEIILSSALHGIICGDAYGIPSYHVNFSPDGDFNWFKFYDYYTSVGRPLTKPPLLLDKNIDIEDLWPPLYNYSINIDLDKLLKACPFKV
jgi:pyruvyltransferase